MVDLETRTAILRLRKEGHGTRSIASALGVARKTVQRVLASGQPEVPVSDRSRSLDEYREAIVALEVTCKGNLVRVHEELRARHRVEVPYSTLTRFCRDEGIGVEPKQAAGRYTFGPGQEMQHDTSPHDVVVGGKTMRLQCASLVHCFSHRRFFQCYPRWNRFTARVFLTRAIVALGGACSQCMLDNSTILVQGLGAAARAVPELVPFEERFGFRFVAHAVGDANRSARVEKPFHHIEINFYPGRTFADLGDLNRQATGWCDGYNGKPNKNLGFCPDEMGALERPHLQPLPLHVPEPVEVHPRRVDAEAYVRLNTNRYSVPEAHIGQSVEVHATWEKVQLFLGHRLIATHLRAPDGAGRRVTLPEHFGQWTRLHPAAPSEEEKTLRTVSPDLAKLCDALRQRHGGQALRAIRRLHRMWTEYPESAFQPAIARAIEFNLVDLERIEPLVLRAARDDFFRLDPHG